MRCKGLGLLSYNIDTGTLSHTYHTATYAVGCGVREREPAEKEPSMGTPRTIYCKFDHKSLHIFYF